MGRCQGRIKHRISGHRQPRRPTKAQVQDRGAVVYGKNHAFGNIGRGAGALIVKHLYRHDAGVVGQSGNPGQVAGGLRYCPCHMGAMAGPVCRIIVAVDDIAARPFIHAGNPVNRAHGLQTGVKNGHPDLRTGGDVPGHRTLHHAQVPLGRIIQIIGHKKSLVFQIESAFSARGLQGPDMLLLTPPVNLQHHQSGVGQHFSDPVAGRHLVRCAGHDHLPLPVHFPAHRLLSGPALLLP